MPRLGPPIIDRRVDIQMTPMIDVVFQLLTFFLMSFRVAAAEGDFNLLLPLESDCWGYSPFVSEEIRIRMP